MQVCGNGRIARRIRLRGEVLPGLCLLVRFDPTSTQRIKVLDRLAHVVKFLTNCR
jgi:hypothetical protein